MESRARQESIIDARRIYIGVLAVLVLFLALLSRLWYLQILRGEDFSIASERNRIREVAQPAPRGLIYDREGELLLSNQPFFDLVIIPQYLSDREKTYGVLAELFHLDTGTIAKRMENASALPNFAPVAIKKNLTLHEVALVESVKFFLPGVDVETKPRRFYRRSESAHLYGYLDEISGRELEAYKIRFPESDYEAQSTIGKMGVEKKFESVLRGKRGREFLLVDAFGRLQTAKAFEFVGMKNEPAARGNDLYLTIDRQVQQAAMEAFKNKNGALVALDPRSGAIRAYVSNPNFSLALFQEGLSTEDWQSLQSNPFKPLLDKVTGGAYPPGSTYKIITAIAALEEGVVQPSRVYNCNGMFTLGNGRWRCWKRTGHGPVNMYQAMAVSCDVWFYQVGNLLGVDRIAKWAQLFGFGERTGLDLNMELPGIVPSTSWKMRTRGVPWQQGDTINVSIGQGYNLTTPIQIVNAFAALGNGGTLYRPYLLDKVVNARGEILEQGASKVVRKIPIKPWVLAAVQRSVKEVVHSEIGTARKIHMKEITISGKTGTAQTAALKRTKDIDNIHLLQRDHAWFAAYSPSEDPEIAVVVLSEYDGGGGSTDAAPIARDVIEAYWRQKDPAMFVERDRLARQTSKRPMPLADEVLPAVHSEGPELPEDPEYYLDAPTVPAEPEQSGGAN